MCAARHDGGVFRAALSVSRASEPEYPGKCTERVFGFRDFPRYRVYTCIAYRDDIRLRLVGEARSWCATRRGRDGEPRDGLRSVDRRRSGRTSSRVMQKRRGREPRKRRGSARYLVPARCESQTFGGVRKETGWSERNTYGPRRGAQTRRVVRLRLRDNVVRCASSSSYTDTGARPLPPPRRSLLYSPVVLHLD